ncbi:MAG: cyclic nucleotide-binding domain-containing protein [Nitrospinae bacterium]|nr:cyclic nucleotide-binding domain-containing protein [Nitrospinota bacterium]MZH40385.1 cyclic nucleotide-binding domain-containing protein [Nitrospinota bacterium]
MKLKLVTIWRYQLEEIRKPWTTSLQLFIKVFTYSCEGQQSNCAYIIDSDLIGVYQEDSHGNLSLVRKLVKNEMFDEIGLINDKPRPATVNSIENRKVSVISKDCFLSLERVNPESLVPLLRVLSGRIRENYKLSNHNNASI